MSRYGLMLLAVTLAACGSSPIAPSQSVPPESATAPPGFTSGRVQIRVDTGLVANRVTTGSNPSVQYSACGQAINAGPGGVTLTVTMTVFLPNGDAYPVT